MSKKFSNFAPEMKKVYQTPVIDVETIVCEIPMLVLADSYHGSARMLPTRDARPVF